MEKTIDMWTRNGRLIEANRNEACDFEREVNGEHWHIDSVWIKQDGEPAWYDGSIHRNGVCFHRIFIPDEISQPAVTRANEHDA